MSRSLIWALLVIGVLLVYRLLTSDTQTHLTPQQQGEQVSFLWPLFVYALFGSPVVLFLVGGIKRYRKTANWVFMVPFFGIVVLYGGIWSYFGYFAEHGGLIMWPLIIGCILAVLTVIWCIDDHRRRKEIVDDATRQLPGPVNHGPTKISDLDDYIDDDNEPEPPVKYYDPPADLLKKYGLDKKAGKTVDHRPAPTPDNTYPIDDYRHRKPRREKSTEPKKQHGPTNISDLDDYL